MRVPDVLRHDSPADHRGIQQGRRLLREHVARFRCAAGHCGNGNEPRVRCALGGDDIEHVVDRGDYLVICIERVKQPHDRPTRGCVRIELLEVDTHLLRAVVEVDDQIAAVVGHLRIRIAGGMIGHREDERILVLCDTEAMPIDRHLFRIVALAVRTQRVARVVQRLRIGRPLHLAKFHEAQDVGQILARRHIAKMPAAPVGAAVGQAVRQQLAVGTGNEFAERHRRIAAELVRIEQHSRHRIERLGHVQDALVLQAVIAQEEVATAALARHVVTLVVPQLGQPLLDFFARRNGFEKWLRHLVLGADPVRDLGRADRFEPAIGIVHAHAMIGVDVINSV